MPAFLASPDSVGFAKPFTVAGVDVVPTARDAEKGQAATAALGVGFHVPMSPVRTVRKPSDHQ